MSRAGFCVPEDEHETPHLEQEEGAEGLVLAPSNSALVSYGSSRQASSAGAYGLSVGLYQPGTREGFCGAMSMSRRRYPAILPAASGLVASGCLNCANPNAKTWLIWLKTLGQARSPTIEQRFWTCDLS